MRFIIPHAFLPSLWVSSANLFLSSNFLTLLPEVECKFDRGKGCPNQLDLHLRSEIISWRSTEMLEGTMGAWMMQTQNGRFKRGKCSNQGCGARKVRLCCGVPCAVLGVVWCLFLLLNSTFSQSDDDHPCMLFAPCSSTIVTHISMFIN